MLWRIEAEIEAKQNHELSDDETSSDLRTAHLDNQPTQRRFNVLT